MTTPASPTEPERCPDCGKALARIYGDGGCLAQCADPHFRTSAKCRLDTIARLRAELASVQALSEAERRVVETALGAHLAAAAIPAVDPMTATLVQVEAERRATHAHAVALDEFAQARISLLALRAKDPTDGT